jgi:hypothetical protein
MEWQLHILTYWLSHSAFRKYSKPLGPMGCWVAWGGVMRCPRMVPTVAGLLVCDSTCGKTVAPLATKIFCRRRRGL